MSSGTNKCLDSPKIISCANCGEKNVFIERLRIRDPLNESGELIVVTCGRCGLCFINPQYSFESYMEYYKTKYFDALGTNYNSARNALTVAYKSHIGESFFDFISKMSSTDNYLDIAAGTGTWLEILFDARPDFPQSNVTVIEPSVTACKDLISRYPSLKLVQQPLESNGLPAESFDFVLCSALIEHFTDPLNGLLHMNRLTRMGGHLMLMTPSLESGAFRYGAARFFKFVHTFYFTEKSLKSITEKAGFRKVSSIVVKGNIKGGLMWFPFLLGVYEKIENINPLNLEVVRRPIADEKSCLDEANILFKRFYFKLLKHRISYNLRATARIIKNYATRK